MKKILLSAIILCSYAMLFSQSITLKPTIGIGPLPNGTDPVCTIPMHSSMYDMNFVTHTSTAFGQSIGDTISAGDTIPHFNLYLPDGSAVDILTELSAGKPILLFGGNITCPIFRNNVTQINNLATLYASQVTTYIIYGVEAHPIIDPSPYSTSGGVWSLENDYTTMGNGNWKYRQPVNYQERKDLVDTLSNRISIVPPILIDGPCNNWWLNFGKAPTNAYLLNTDGTIYCYHGWFDQPPLNMTNCINALLASMPVTENNLQESIRVYPNPSAGVLKIDNSNLYSDEIKIIEVYNVFSERVFTQAINTDHETLNFSLPAGPYFYKIIFGDKTITSNRIISSGKLVIQ